LAKAFYFKNSFHTETREMLSTVCGFFLQSHKANHFTLLPLANCALLSPSSQSMN